MNKARTIWSARLGRRAVLAIAGSVLLAGCTPRYEGQRLKITTGTSGAVYHQLGATLAEAWRASIGIETEVLTSAGSGQNLDRLLSGEADLAISAADAAADRAADPAGKSLRALARMHDDYVQVVVPARAGVEHLADLRGARVSVGPADSGVRLIADRLLVQAGLFRDDDLDRRGLAIDASARALARGEIDAFFWSGGLPTEPVANLAKQMPIRLLDLSDVLGPLTTVNLTYHTGTVPAASYSLPSPVTTLVVPNFLMVTEYLANDLARELTQGVFDAQAALAKANPAARSIDLRSGIETVPIPLHDGALDYYRSVHYGAHN